MLILLFAVMSVESNAGHNNSSEDVTLPSFPICKEIGDQAFGQIAHNTKDNEYLVVWQDFRSVSEELGLRTPGLVYGQLISLSGELLGDEIPVSVDNIEDARTLPVDAYNPVTNEYLVVFLRKADVYGRFLKNDGSPRGEEFAIRVGPETQAHPSVVYNPTRNNFFVLWNDNRTGKNENDVYGVFINNAGTKDGEEFVICDVPKDQYYPAVVYNPKDDEFMIIYEDFRDCTLDPCYTDISSLFGRRVSIDGKLLGDEFIVSKDGNDKRQQNFCFNPNLNEYMVAWNDKRNETTTQNKDIYALRLKNDGMKVGNEFAVCTAPNDQGYCTIAYDPSEHTYLMVWNDFRDNPPIVLQNLLNWGMGTFGGNVIYDPGTVYGRWYDDDGQPSGAEFILCEESKGNQMLALARYYPIAGSFGQYFIVWSDMRIEANKRDIYGKFIEKQTCPATLLLQDQTALNLLRLFRDTVLAKSDQGQSYIDLYYRHAAEVTSLLNSDEELKQEAASLLKALLPSVKVMMKGKALYLGKDNGRKVEEVLNLCSAKASPGLKGALETIKKNLKMVQ
jgi:hypothetical protein